MPTIQLSQVTVDQLPPLTPLTGAEVIPVFIDGKTYKVQTSAFIVGVDQTILDAKASTVTMNAALALKADAITVNAALVLKADATALATKADAATINAALVLKADATALATKADAATINAALALKADTSALATKADTTTVNAALALKADAADLATKADTTAVNDALALKLDVAGLAAIAPSYFVALTGPSLAAVPVGTPIVFTITNYDSYTTYLTSTNNGGSVVNNNDGTFTYTASTVGTETVQIGNRALAVTVVA